MIRYSKVEVFLVESLRREFQTSTSLFQMARNAIENHRLFEMTQLNWANPPIFNKRFTWIRAKRIDKIMKKYPKKKMVHLIMSWLINVTMSNSRAFRRWLWRVCGPVIHFHFIFKWIRIFSLWVRFFLLDIFKCSDLTAYNVSQVGRLKNTHCQLNVSSCKSALLYRFKVKPIRLWGDKYYWIYKYVLLLETETVSHRKKKFCAHFFGFECNFPVSTQNIDNIPWFRENKSGGTKITA